MILYRAFHNLREVIGTKELIEKILLVPNVLVYSSWRSLEEQKKLVETKKSKTLLSNHRRGMAVDCINWQEIEKDMWKQGLLNDLTWDKNHFSLGGETKASKYPLVDNPTIISYSKNLMFKLIKEKRRPEVFAIFNGKNYYIGSLDAFNDLEKEGYAKWENVEEVNYPIKIDGIIK